MTLKFTAALLATTVFCASTALAQSTPIPKTEGHGPHDGHNHSTPVPAKDVPFSLTEAPDDHVIGDDKAAVTMIGYFSVTCPHCSDWFINEWPAVKKDLVEAGKMRFILRELPTAPAQLSMIGFMMAECAPSEDYYKLIEYQMENQKDIFKQAEAGKAREAYDKIGKLAGLENAEDIQACLSDTDKLGHIHISGERANAAQVQGVPAIYINGDIYEGEQSAKALIDLVSNMNEKGLSKLPASLP